LLLCLSMTNTAYIEGIYTVFSEYRFKPGFAERCSPITQPSVDEVLALCKNVRELSDDDLGRFPGKALTTWGDEEDFKHFLPRIIETSILTPDGLFEENFFFKIESAKFKSWPEEEKEVVTVALIQYLTNKLHSFPNSYGIDFLPQIIALLGIETVKQIFMDDNSAQCAYFISDSILNPKEYMFDLLGKEQLSFNNWLNSPVVKQKLLAAISKGDDEYLTYTIQTALDYLNKTSLITTNHIETNS
jgi:hypothetical protein